MTEKHHISDIPFIDNEVMYFRVGNAQFWRNPEGGWDITDYRDVLKTIDRLQENSALS